MEIEGSDIHIDKEPDGVIIYANGITSDSSYGKPSQMPEIIDIDPQLVDTSEENSEVQDCVVKECNSEKPAEESVPISKSEVEKDDLKTEAKKIRDHDKKTQSCGKRGTRAAIGNCKTKCTVPQPFALATEKRALHGTRPNGAECDNTTGGDKASHVRVPLQPSSAKQNLVSLLISFLLIFSITLIFPVNTSRVYFVL